MSHANCPPSGHPLLQAFFIYSHHFVLLSAITLPSGEPRFEVEWISEAFRWAGEGQAGCLSLRLLAVVVPQIDQCCTASSTEQYHGRQKWCSPCPPQRWHRSSRPPSVHASEGLPPWRPPPPCRLPLPQSVAAQLDRIEPRGNIQFLTGAALRGGSLLLSYGINDCFCALAEVPGIWSQLERWQELGLGTQAHGPAQCEESGDPGDNVGCVDSRDEEGQGADDYYATYGDKDEET